MFLFVSCVGCGCGCGFWLAGLRLLFAVKEQLLGRILPNDGAFFKLAHETMEAFRQKSSYQVVSASFWQGPFRHLLLPPASATAAAESQ